MPSLLPLCEKQWVTGSSTFIEDMLSCGSLYSWRVSERRGCHPAPGLRHFREPLLHFCPDFTGVSFDTARLGAIFRIGRAFCDAFGGRESDRGRRLSDGDRSAGYSGEYASSERQRDISGSGRLC